MPPEYLTIIAQLIAVSATVLLAYQGHRLIVDLARIFTEFLARLAGK